MHKSFKPIILLISFLFLLSSIYGKTKNLILNDVLQQRYENNVLMQIEELSLKGKKNDKKAVYNFLYPQISTSIELFRSNTAQSRSLLTPNTSSLLSSGAYGEVRSSNYKLSPTVLMGTLSESLMLNAAMFNGIKIARLEYESGLLSRENLEMKTKRDLSKNFFSLLIMKVNIDILKSSLDTMKKRYDQTRTDYNNRRISELVLLNTRMAYENIIPSVQLLENQYKNLLNLLKVNLGIDVDIQIDLIGEIGISGMDITTLDTNASKLFNVRLLNMTIRQLKAGTKNFLDVQTDDDELRKADLNLLSKKTTIFHHFLIWNT